MTDHNPYTPPSAVVAEDPVAAIPPKPWAVTIAQVLGAGAALMLAVVVTRYLYAMWEWHQIGVRMVWYPMQMAYRVAVLVLLIVMLIQLPKRSQIGRWCGALLLVVLLSCLIYLLAGMDPPDTQSPGELFGYVLGFLLTFMPVAWWLYAFAFSRKARAYFRSAARN